MEHPNNESTENWSPPASEHRQVGPGLPYQLPPNTPAPPPPPVKPPKAKRFGWPTMLIVAVGSWFIGFLMASIGSTGEPVAAPAPKVTVTTTETFTAAPSSEPSSPPAKKTAPPKPTASTMGEGTYQIGVDAPAGRYKAVVPADSYNCYWERSEDDSGDSIIANNNLNAGARASVSVQKGEFFTSSGCGTWTKV